MRAVLRRPVHEGGKPTCTPPTRFPDELCSMPRRISPKELQPNADTEGESVKFGHSRTSSKPTSARMSTKTTKRKRAATVAAIEPAPEPNLQPTQTPVDVKVAEPVVRLFSNSTVKDAAALKDTLLQVLEVPGSVAIDAKSVERIDTAVIQVLCAFVRDRTARNLAVSWHGTTQPLLDAVRLLGVGSLLALPSPATETPR